MNNAFCMMHDALCVCLSCRMAEITTNYYTTIYSMHLLIFPIKKPKDH
jgi:hypothetical protein